MKRLFMFLGGLLLGVFALGGIMFACVIVTGTTRDKESYSYVMETVPVICSSFNYDTFDKYASDELKKANTQEEIARISNFIKKLGNFSRVAAIHGESNINLISFDITAKYSANVEFQSGAAVIDIVLVKENDAWKYYKFHVNITKNDKKSRDAFGDRL